MSKYSNLDEHFRGLSGSSWHATFQEIERIIGSPLLRSARTYPAWWANSQDMPHKLHWLGNGWRTQDLNLSAGHVLFVRQGGIARAGANASPARPPAPPSVRSTSSPHAWDKGLRQFECRLGLSWKPIGRVELGPDNRLIFPDALSSPGIYCFRVRQGSGERRYVGQSENIARRFGFYRNPGPSQQTNARLNAEFRAVLGVGAEIGVSIATGAFIDWGEGSAPADLSLLATRCLLENAAILEFGATDIESLNRP